MRQGHQVRGRWVHTWEVPSHSSDTKYRVSISSELQWGCSCKHWIFRRNECPHIRDMKLKLQVDKGDAAAAMRLTSILIDYLRRDGKTADEIFAIMQKQGDLFDCIEQVR